MVKQLGLHISANSIGWCLVEDEAGLLGLGVRAFSSGRDPQSGMPLSKTRNAARAARRRRDGYLGRRRALLRTLIAHGLMPSSWAESKALSDLDPYLLRARALSERLHPFEIGRVLFHINQRRGFRPTSSGVATREDFDLSAIAIGVSRLNDALARGSFQTLGQYLNARLVSGSDARARRKGEDSAYAFFPDRTHLEDEFARIWAEQSKHHGSLMNDDAREALRHILFSQKLPKRQAPPPCPRRPDEGRIHQSSSLFQDFRLYKTLNELEVVGPGTPLRPLTLGERDTLVPLLSKVRAARLDRVARKLGLPPGHRLVTPNGSGQILGKEVPAVLARTKTPLSLWTALSSEEREELWARLSADDAEQVSAEVVEDDLADSDATQEILGTKLPRGRGRYGPTFTRLLLEELRNNVVTEAEAERRISLRDGNPSKTGTAEAIQSRERLPYYGEALSNGLAGDSGNESDPPEARWGAYSDPTTHIWLRQLEKLVNAIIDAHGRPDHISVSIDRELKVRQRQRELRKRRIRIERSAGPRRSQLLMALGQADTGANRALLRAWEALDPGDPAARSCLYCGEPITQESLFEGAVTISLIIPYSRSLDDGPTNKIAAHRRCNQEKGSRVPFEAWGHDQSRWRGLIDRVSRLRLSQQWRFAPNAMARSDRKGDVFTRHFSDMHPLSRSVRAYLSVLYQPSQVQHVHVLSGRLTAPLRRHWGLNTLLGDHVFARNRHSEASPNRLDLRHAAIDAAIAAVTTPALVNQIIRLASAAEQHGEGHFSKKLGKPWLSFREDLGPALARVTVSHKADHGSGAAAHKGVAQTSGQLHDESAYGLTGRTGRLPGTYEVVHRIPFSALSPKDIADPVRIRDPHLRHELARVTHGFADGAFAAALSHFAQHHLIFRGVRRVRVLGERAGATSLNVVLVRDQNGYAYKAYKSNANARYEVWRLPDGSWTHQVISVFAYNRHDAQPERPHPAARKNLSLYQNDLVAIERTAGSVELMRVVKFNSRGQITLALHFEGGALKARDAASSDPFRYLILTASGLKKFKARQVRVDLLGRVFDPGPRP